jgi:hypothetical protein
VNFYKTGAGDGSATNPTALADGGNPLRIGLRGDGWGLWGGKLAEMRLYNRALSSEEIAQHYANQNAPGTFWSAVGALEQV